MTRDEAIAKTKAAMHNPGGIVWCSNQSEADAAIAKIERDAEHFVDASVALGMLKLDEPKSKVERIRALCGMLDCGPNWLTNKLDDLNLKIVEK